MRAGLARLAAGGALVALLALAGPVATGGTTRASAAGQSFTPVIADVVSVPRWYRGIDNRVHVEYELRLTNGFPVAATVERIEVLRGAGGNVATLEGERLAQAISPVGSPAQRGSVIPPNSAAFAFIDLSLPGRDQLPKHVSHRISTRIDPGDLPVPPTNIATEARTRVHQQRPIPIDPPLSGPRWSAIIEAHRRAVQPINGRFRNGQRFALDWNRLDEQYRPAFGDPATFASNPSYGAPVLAVGDAKVVMAVDGIPNQPPDSFTPVGADRGDGNVVVLKLRPRVYAGYAHLIPNSVRVEAGDQVRSGDVLGELGNSGNSNGPHLHFQLMNAPSLLAADGLPVVFRRFDLEGIVPSLDVFGDAFVNQTPVPFSTVGAGPYRNRGPVGLDIFDLP